MEKLWKIRHTTGKRLLYVMMSLCMIMLQFPITASASTKYDLWVGGVRVTDDNAGNITGDNISGTVSYDNDTNTLTLNNATITSVVDGKGSLGEESHGIYAGPNFGTLTIVLEGNNTITGGNGKRSFGISIDGSGLIFSGNGSLQVSADNGDPDEEDTWSVAVFSFGKIVINSGCTMEASCGTASYVAAPFYSSTEGLVELKGTKIVAATDKNGNPVSNPKDLLLNIREYSYMKFEPDTGDTYSISLDWKNIYFSPQAGYSNLTPETVTVTNTGTGATGELTVELFGSGSHPDKFTLSTNKISSLPAGEFTSFTVVPKDGCAVGRYNDAIVRVTGGNDIYASVQLNFTVYPETPTIKGTLTDAVYSKGKTAVPLTVSASVTDGGTLSYQWAIDNGATSDIIKGATNPTFTPPTDTVGTTTYYCLVTNTKNGVSMEKFSESVTITVKEEGSDTDSDYDIWVGGVQVTSANADNITGSNIRGTVSYDDSTKTLTLDDAMITATTVTASGYDDTIGIYSKDSLNIELKGSNTIIGTASEQSSYGIYIYNDLEFTGNGSLQASAVDCEYMNSWSVAIYAGGCVTVNSGCTIEATCGTANITAAPIYRRLILDGVKVSDARDTSGNTVSEPGYDYSDLKNYIYIKLEPDTVVTYSISLSPETVWFSQWTGHDPTAKTITVTNTGTAATGELTVELFGSGSHPDKFTLSTNKISSLAAGESASFTVVPKDGCAVGRYNEAIVRVIGDNDIYDSVQLNFTVYPEPPTITGVLTDAVYSKGETAVPLNVSASVTDGGTLSYQWAIDKGGDTFHPVEGATSSTFIPPTDTVGTVTYYCRVTNTVKGISIAEDSQRVTLTVTESSSTPDPDSPSHSGSAGSGDSGNSNTPSDPAVIYQIIEGVEGSWIAGSNAGLTIRGNGEFSKFTGVKVDGILLDQSNYTAKEGSTIITLQASWLNALAAGKHTVEILWTDGSAATTFTINANTSTDSALPSDTAKKDDVPKTGDSTPIVWMFLLAGFSGMGLLLTRKKGRWNWKAVRKH